MEIVGYTKNDEFTDVLKEATITCSAEELRSIIEFLKGVEALYENAPGQYCQHLRDNSRKWDRASSDLIVLIP